MEALARLLATLNQRPRIAYVAIAGACVAIAAVAFFALGIGRTASAPLFARPLDSSQLSEVEERFAEWSVAFLPQPDNVLVDTKRRNELLLRLSLVGVPHGHVATTTEALANIGVLTPQSVIDAQTRSGLAGEIELALRSVEGVDDATVIIAPAKVAEFADETAHDGSASVRLHLKAGAHISSTSVNGIRSYVAASIQGLDPSRVTILDDRGLALGDPTTGSDDASGLERSLQSALDAVLGAGVAVVRVHAEYSSTQMEARNTRRAPVGDAITRNVRSESYDGAGRRYRKDEERDERGNDVSETVSRTPAGTLARVNTAVFVDMMRVVDIAKVRQLAAASVGYDPRRGDTLSVQAVDFHHGLEQKHDAWFWFYGTVAPLLPTVAILICVLVVARKVFPQIVEIAQAAFEREATSRTSKLVAGYKPAQVRGALAHEPPHAAAAIISALPAATAAAVLELYPPQERQAIIARMQRVHSPLIPRADEILGHHA
jgi:flagellar M-ring protein FliF